MTPAVAAAEAALPRHVRRAISRLAHARSQAYEAELRQALLRAAARRWPLGCGSWTVEMGDRLIEIVTADVLGANRT